MDGFDRINGTAHNVAPDLIGALTDALGRVPTQDDLDSFLTQLDGALDEAAGMARNGDDVPEGREAVAGWIRNQYLS